MTILPVAFAATLVALIAPSDQAAPSAAPSIAVPVPSATGIVTPAALPTLPPAPVPTPAPAMLPTPMVMPTASPAPSPTEIYAPTPRPETPAPEAAARPTLAELISRTPHLNQVLAPDRTVDLFYLRLGTERTGVEGYVPATDPQTGLLKSGATAASVLLMPSRALGATHALIWTSTGGKPYRYVGTISAPAGHLTIDLKHGYVDVVSKSKTVHETVTGGKLTVVR